MTRLLLVGPNAWDLHEGMAAAARRGVRLDVADHPGLHVEARGIFRQGISPFDLEGWMAAVLERARRHRPEGIIGTDDYLSCAAASVLARRLDLPGPDPRAVLLAQHKLHARSAVGRACPDLAVDHAAVPLEDPDPPALAIPYWIKPVRGTFSVLARRVGTPEDYRGLLSFSFLERRIGRNLVRPFQGLIDGLELGGPPVDQFIAERELRGRLVTVEGLRVGGIFQPLGITDSAFHPGTTDFLRFDYPSTIPAAVGERLERAAGRVAAALGLERTVFNAEFFWEEAGNRIDLLEVNPRMAYQFADLHEKVDGWNTYDLQVALALGESPAPPRGRGRHRAAVSYVIRHFGEGTVERVPTEDEVARVLGRFPGARVRTYVRTGDRLRGSFGAAGHRLAVINLGGSGREELDLAAARAAAALPIAVKRSRAASVRS